ncbi:asparagine synthase-related protein [Paenibacillus tarimensis]
MSAITGIYHLNREHVLLDDSQALMHALHHYPSDSIQNWYAGEIFLGCHAQWITPESIDEQLPYYNSELKLAITADAIVDNRQELFERLQIEHAHRMKMPDSELILLAYHRWGFESPKFLVGDFAFVIWDERNKTMFGARDLPGNRSLYYNLHGDRFAFSTMISPLLHLPGVKKQLNEAWMAEFLSIPILLDSTDYHATAYRNIYQLPPAHTIKVVNGIVSITQYASLAASDKLQLKSNGEYEEAFRDVFRTVVQSKLRTFRQVGATLSGGLDSGAVVSFAAGPLQQEGKTLRTYSYIPVEDFTDWTPGSRMANESPFIREIVRHVANISDNYLDFAGRNSYSEVDDWLELLESPYKFFENSFWIRGIYEQASQQGIGVLLTGARGNFSISWGPALNYYVQLFRKLRLLHFYREIKSYSQRMRVGRSRLLPLITREAFPILTKRSPSKGNDDEPLLIHPDFAAKTNVFDRLRNQDVGLTPSSIDPLIERESYFNNLAIMNMQGTSGAKMSLRYRLWERDPTCDPRVVRFCLSLPIEQYVQQGLDRALIRRATKGYLPDSVRMNQRVRGVQGADWVHRLIPVWNRFNDEIDELCKDSNMSSLLNVDQIKQYLVKVGSTPRPECAFDPEMRFLMRGLIAYRFMKRF